MLHSSQFFCWCVLTSGDRYISIPFHKPGGNYLAIEEASFSNSRCCRHSIPTFGTFSRLRGRRGIPIIQKRHTKSAFDLRISSQTDKCPVIRSRPSTLCCSGLLAEIQHEVLFSYEQNHHTATGRMMQNIYLLSSTC